MKQTAKTLITQASTLGVVAYTTLGNAFAQGLNTNLVGNVQVNQTTGLLDLIRNAINIVIGFLAFIAVVVIIIEGVKLARGSSDEKAYAKSIVVIRNSVIGLILVVVSYAIVQFVINLIQAAVTGGQVQ